MSEILNSVKFIKEDSAITTYSFTNFLEDKTKEISDSIHNCTVKIDIDRKINRRNKWKNAIKNRKRY